MKASMQLSDLRQALKTRKNSGSRLTPGSEDVGLHLGDMLSFSGSRTNSGFLD